MRHANVRNNVKYAAAALFVVPMALSLTGCKTPNSAAAIAEYKQTCAMYGYEPGTSDFAQCVQSRAHENEKDFEEAFDSDTTVEYEVDDDVDFDEEEEAPNITKEDMYEEAFDDL